MKYAPELRFEYDTGFDRADRIERLLQAAQEKRSPDESDPFGE